jgi:hypothetical protein
MPHTAEHSLSSPRYEALFKKGGNIPSRQELIDLQIASLTDLGLTAERHIRRLTSLVPDRELFLLCPAWTDRSEELLMRLASRIVTTDPLQREHAGQTSLDPARFAEMRLPENDYVVTFIEDGRGSLNQPPLEVAREVEDAGRMVLSPWEGLLFAACFPVLEHHGLNFCLRYRDDERVVALGGFRPTLGLMDPIADERYGVPSGVRCLLG